MTTIPQGARARRAMLTTTADDATPTPRSPGASPRPRAPSRCWRAFRRSVSRRARPSSGPRPARLWGRAVGAAPPCGRRPPCHARGAWRGGPAGSTSRSRRGGPPLRRPSDLARLPRGRGTWPTGAPGVWTRSARGRHRGSSSGRGCRPARGLPGQGGEAGRDAAPPRPPAGPGGVDAPGDPWARRPRDAAGGSGVGAGPRAAPTPVYMVEAPRARGRGAAHEPLAHSGCSLGHAAGSARPPWGVPRQVWGLSPSPARERGAAGTVTCPASGQDLWPPPTLPPRPPHGSARCRRWLPDAATAEASEPRATIGQGPEHANSLRWMGLGASRPPPSHPPGRSGHDCGGSADAVRGDTPPTCVSSPGVPAASSSQMRGIARHLAGGHLATPRQAPPPLDRSGLQHATACLLGPRLTPACRSAMLSHRSVPRDSRPASRGKSSHLPCLSAGFTQHALRP
jgi:hypothetical protein